MSFSHLRLCFPGIGPKSADKIIAARRETRLRDISQLKALGVTTGLGHAVCAARRAAVGGPAQAVVAKAAVSLAIRVP
jgi:predicted DNA-binding helix-hairpin-helix protein